MVAVFGTNILSSPNIHRQGKSPKVLSFGGWSFSTDLDSYAIFRKGVTDEQRSLFASKVVEFADDHGLDVLDFDWEYPSAPNIPGIPKGDPGDGDRYLKFLKEVRSKLSSEKTLSIAAPSPYWYLKGFLIKEISDIVDCNVFMTYDLHGRWDWNNSHAADGCDGGSCLRSHVNHTEIMNSFLMITRAGVPNNKIFVGLASYDWSFGMKDPDCYGPECKFTGPESGAVAGRCTKTPGYIANAEIQEWLDGNGNITSTYFDEPSQSTISYSTNGTWVAYNTEDERSHRITTWHGDETVRGTCLWAIDLTEFVVELPNSQAMDLSFELSSCTDSFDNLEDLEAATRIDDYCMNTYLMQAVNGKAGSINMDIPSLGEELTINNPKDVISQRLPNITTFQEHLDFISILSANVAYGDSTSDVVDGASMLAFMVSKSVTSMSQVSAGHPRPG